MFQFRNKSQQRRRRWRILLSSSERWTMRRRVHSRHWRRIMLNPMWVNDELTLLFDLRMFNLFLISLYLSILKYFSSGRKRRRRQRTRSMQHTSVRDRYGRLRLNEKWGMDDKEGIVVTKLHQIGVNYLGRIVSTIRFQWDSRRQRWIQSRNRRRQCSMMMLWGEQCDSQGWFCILT